MIDAFWQWSIALAGIVLPIIVIWITFNLIVGILYGNRR